MDTGWLFGQVYGIPRWMLAGGLFALVILVRARRAARRPPDGGETVTPIRYKQYRTVSRRRAA